MLKQGDSLDLILAETVTPDLVVIDPPYAFGGSGGVGVAYWIVFVRRR